MVGEGATQPGKGRAWDSVGERGPATSRKTGSYCLSQVLLELHCEGKEKKI